MPCQYCNTECPECRKLMDIAPASVTLACEQYPGEIEQLRVLAAAIEDTAKTGNVITQRDAKALIEAANG